MTLGRTLQGAIKGHFFFCFPIWKAQNALAKNAALWYNGIKI